jgi:DNA-binding HxlR family transcriptional regulator
MAPFVEAGKLVLLVERKARHMNPRGTSTSRCLSCARMIIGKVQYFARVISVCREPLQVSEGDQLATSCRTGQHKEYDAYCEQCPCRALLDLLANKWSALIIGLLDDGAAVRFTELKVALPGIGPKMLTQTLRRLESASLVDRTVYAEVPPRVELNRPGNGGDSCSGHLAVGGLLMVALLELDRWLVGERRVQPGDVVPVDPGGGFAFQFGPAGERGVLIYQLRLIQSHSRFHQSIVQGVPHAADRSGDAGLVQGLGERDRRVLAARVRVMHQTCCSKTELGVRRVNSACSKTDVTSGVVLLLITRHPRMRRENTSTQNAV